MDIKSIPNIITALRIFGTFLMIFIKPFTALFYTVYSLTGVTDILDGFIARKLNLTSKLGAMLDSIADLFFYTVMILKILPVLWAILPTSIWYAVAVAVIIRLLAYLVAAIKFRQFASMHTRLNKLTGLAVFCVPFILTLPCYTEICAVVCLIAAVASLEELLIHIFKKA